MLVLVGSGRALGVVWRLSTDTSLVVGRKDSPLLIEGDKSVSRVHATIITVAEDLSGVDVQDEGSKFGIYINGKQCPSRSLSRLLVGDEIMFGAQDSVFHLRRYPIALCVANMRTEPPSAVDRVLAVANSLGMDIVDDIEHCTHLLMPVLTITTKLIRALVFGCWLVSPEYIYSLEQLPLSFRIQSPSTELVDEYVESLKFLPPTQAPLPSPECPVDLSTVNWNPDKERQHLFASKLFAFADATQMDKYYSLIRAAGGSCVLLRGAVDWTRSRLPSAESFKTRCASLADNMQTLANEAKSGTVLPLKCLVLPPSLATSGVQSDMDTTVLITEVARLLNVRPISESEIGLAVIFVSNETHTNPVVGVPSVPSLGTMTDPQVPPVTIPTAESSDLLRRRRAPRISSFWNDKVAADASRHQANDSIPSANLEDARTSMEALSVVSPTVPPAQESGSVVSATVQVRTRRRAGLEGFWANAVSGSEQLPRSEGGGQPPASSENTSTLSPNVPVGETTASEPVQARPRRRAGLEGFWANAVSGSEQISSPVSDGQPATSSTRPDAPVSEDSGTLNANASTPAAMAIEEHHGMAVEIISLVKSKQYSATCQAEHSSGAPNFKRFRKTVHLYQLA
ncbi:hypothetical protein IW146_007974 [Coemansia sp. RSA 922]|nr:hypothetical protein H4S03_007499 [Coemansia sp. S3946]KAJ2042962.1 hypothetical protein H4S04_007024 [Coemansia sp. S16]KAJ2106014.1 hypothetical protein IW146_007974 [Coemansia sp. RSA 922]